MSKPNTPKKRTNPNAMKIKCPVCCAGRDEPCTGPKGGPRKLHGPRHEKAWEIHRARRKNLRKARKAKGHRFEGVKITFRCPICKGAHSRADHDAAMTVRISDVRQRARRSSRTSEADSWRFGRGQTWQEEAAEIARAAAAGLTEEYQRRQ